jgi:glycosyltransferase involved in cell wall biosynthesis
MPGANRPYGWAKYLQEFGYYPVIVTRSWEHEVRRPADILQSSGKEIKHEVFPTHEVYYLPYKQNLRDKIYTRMGDNRLVFFRKFLTFLEIFFSYFFSFASSMKPLYFFSKKILKSDKSFVGLIATGAPYLLFRFAYLLNKKYGIKWIADYRDDWNTSDIDANRTQSLWFLKWIEINKEKIWIRSASFHTAVSPYSVEKNSKFLNKKGYTIHNGYLEEDIVGKEENSLFQDFTITFIGTLYPTQNIEIFLSAFKQFIQNNKDHIKIQLLFPGLAYDKIQSKRVAGFLKGFEKYFTITERVPKSEIVQIEQKTHVFLYTAHKMRGIIGSKIYEYVGLKKPVIFCPSDKETIEEIFNETGVGFCCDNSEDVLIALEKLYTEFTKGEMKLHFSAPQIERINFYSRRSQTRVLAELLDKI